MTDRYEAQVALTQGVALKDANGDPDPQRGTDGTAHVTERVTSGTLGFGLAQNREDVAPTTGIKTMMFPDGTGPTTINVGLASVTNVLATPDWGRTEVAYFVINASSDQHAANELTTPPSIDSSTERYTIYDILVKPAGQDISSVTPIDRIDYKMSALAATAIITIGGA